MTTLKNSKVIQRTNIYLRQHHFAFYQALRDLLVSPLASLLSFSVIAIALALPGGLFLFLENGKQMTENWNNDTQISVFLADGVVEQQVDNLIDSISDQELISNTQYLTKQMALVEFEKQMDLGDLTQILDDNPLPAVLLIDIKPMKDLAGQVDGFIDQVNRLSNQLSNSPIVDDVQLDVIWLERFNRLVELTERFIGLLSLILGLAILLIVGNTIRLLLERQKDAVLVMKLVGGTNAYVKRPFIYAGLWLGLVGAVFANLLIYLFLLGVAGPIVNLVSLYDMSFVLIKPDGIMLLSLIAAGMFISMFGAWLTVTVQLRKLQVL